MVAKLVMVSSSSGDWYGLYKDGKLVMEDHELSASQVLNALGIVIEHREAKEDWVENRGNFPVLLKDVKFRK